MSKIGVKKQETDRVDQVILGSPSQMRHHSYCTVPTHFSACEGGLAVTEHPGTTQNGHFFHNFSTKYANEKGHQK